jgi:hypothetical protein
MADGGAAMAASELDFDSIARDLVCEHKARLFPGNAAEVEILDTALSPPRHFRWGCFHRWLQISYRHSGRPTVLKLWLKFGPGLDRLFPTLAAYDARFDGQVFPRPYFSWHSPDSDTGMLATAFVEGKLLRDEFLRLAFRRQTRRLEPVLRVNGAKMREFHDAFAPTEKIAVADFTAELNGLLRTTSYFSYDERLRVMAHLARHAASLPAAALPAVRTHNDWVLRNIILTRDGTDYVIDNQDLLCPPNWRWSDIALFLLNLEVQLKWFPLTKRRMMSRLWSAFWTGYVGDRGIPDGLRVEHVPAVLYLTRLQWLIHGVIRQPYFDIMGRRFNRHFRWRLKNAVLRGDSSLLVFAGSR